MNTLTFANFGRLAPVLKARTVLKRRIADEGAVGGSPTNMGNIADSLAVGWLEEAVTLQRQGATHLRRADETLGEVIDFATGLCREHEVPSGESILFFTMLEGVRHSVREALTRVALAGVAVAVCAALLSADAELARRGTRMVRKGRKDEIALICAETGGAL